jgi:hypothetical protein
MVYCGPLTVILVGIHVIMLTRTPDDMPQSARRPGNGSRLGLRFAQFELGRVLMELAEDDLW